MRARERGGGLLIVALLLVTAASFAVVIAATQSGGDIKDTDSGAESVQAMYLAETGIERALKRFATSASATPCASLTAETITNLTTIGLGASGHTIAILAGDTTDFSGATLPLSQCRVRATGTVDASGVSRTLHAIVDRNLLEGPDNPTFNNPTTAGAPSGWTITTTPPVGYPAGFANTGGPDCTRSAWLVKTAQGAFTSTSTTTVPVVFSTTAGSTTTITFHWRLGPRTPAVGCNAGANTGPAFPGAPCPAAAGDGQVCFRFLPIGAGGGTFLQKNATAAGAAVACPAGVDPGTPAVHAPCTNQYQVPATIGFVYPIKEQLSFVMGGGNVTSFAIAIRLRQAGRKEMFLDHIEATNPTAIGAAHVKRWRDCSGAPNPVTCL